MKIYQLKTEDSEGNQTLHYGGSHQAIKKISKKIGVRIEPKNLIVKIIKSKGDLLSYLQNETPQKVLSVISDVSNDTNIKSAFADAQIEKQMSETAINAKINEISEIVARRSECFECGFDYFAQFVNGTEEKLRSVKIKKPQAFAYAWNFDVRPDPKHHLNEYGFDEWKEIAQNHGSLISHFRFGDYPDRFSYGYVEKPIPFKINPDFN
tara:strand:- start:1367 stop:1993 length:627 start_codon:yes stop_codon:yes gene_type:complete